MNTVDAKILLKEIKDSGKKVSKWEKDFLASVRALVKEKKYLSKAQGSKLQQLYRKSQGGGLYI